MLESRTSLEKIPKVKGRCLEHLQLPNVDVQHDAPLSIQLLALNLGTLRHLEIGNELETMQYFPGPAFVTAARSLDSLRLENLAKWTKGNRVELPWLLESLQLTNCDLEALLSKQKVFSSNFEHLSSLTLRSCTSMDSALENLKVMNSIRTPPSAVSHLRHLDIRMDLSESDRTIQDSLSHFLSSFEGLEDLRLLLDAARPLDRKWTLHSSIIINHGSTLRVLVLDVRDGPRNKNMHRVESLPPPNYYRRDPVGYLRYLCDGCPNLEELGVTLPWMVSRLREEDVNFKNVCTIVSDHDGSTDDKEFIYPLTLLKKLHTVNIRNMPCWPGREEENPNVGEDGGLDCLTSFSPWPMSRDQMFHALATNIAQEIANPRSALSDHAIAQEKPSLRTIVIGSLKYYDVCAGTYHPAVEGSEHAANKQRVYAVEHYTNSRGVRKVDLTEVGKHRPCGAKDECKNASILDQYWLF